MALVPLMGVTRSSPALLSTGKEGGQLSVPSHAGLPQGVPVPSGDASLALRKCTADKLALPIPGGTSPPFLVPILSLRIFTCPQLWGPGSAPSPFPGARLPAALPRTPRDPARLPGPTFALARSLKVAPGTQLTLRRWSLHIEVPLGGACCGCRPRPAPQGASGTHPETAGRPAACAWAPTRLPFPSVAGQRGRAGGGSLRGQQTLGGLSGQGRPPRPFSGHSSCLLDPPLPAGHPQWGTQGLYDRPLRWWGKQSLSDLDAERRRGAGPPGAAGARAGGHPPTSRLPGITYQILPFRLPPLRPCFTGASPRLRSAHVQGRHRL